MQPYYSRSGRQGVASRAFMSGLKPYALTFASSEPLEPIEPIEPLEPLERNSKSRRRRARHLIEMLLSANLQAVRRSPWVVTVGGKG